MNIQQNTLQRTVVRYLRFWNVWLSTEKESYRNETWYENTMGGDEYKKYGKPYLDKEKSYNWYSKGPENDQTR